MPVFQRMPGMKTWNGFAMVVGRRAAGALLTAFIAGWVFFTFHAPATDWLDRFLRDSAQAVGMRFREATPNLAIVCIDAETLETVPGRWPWPRAEFAACFANWGKASPGSSSSISCFSTSMGRSHQPVMRIWRPR